MDGAVSETGTTSNVDGADSNEESVSNALAAEPQRKIPHNPPAGDVYHREQGSPWRVRAERQIHEGNVKAREEQAEKRRWGLAKQVQDGLKHNYGINYGVAELAALLKDGIAMKKQGKPDLSPNEVALVQFLAAAEKYDLKQLVMLIDKFPKGRTAASSASKKK